MSTDREPASPEESPPEDEKPIEQIPAVQAEAAEVVDPVDELLHTLQSGDAQERTDALSGLTEAGGDRADVVTAIEQAALNDRSKAVRAAAVEALASPGLLPAQYSRHTLSAHQRQTILLEVRRWVKEGILAEDTGNILQARYPISSMPIRTKQSEPAREPKEALSLTQVLLSEATLQVAFYLGAFFFLIAAAFFSSAIEEWRIPILLITTLFFFGSAAGLFKKLRQASFVFAIIATIMGIIDMAVILDTANASERLSLLGMGAALLVTSALWITATWIYKSRMMSVLALWGAFWGAFTLGNGIDIGDGLVFFLLALFTGLAMAGVFVLKEWEVTGKNGNPISMHGPLLVFSTLQMAGILFFGFAWYLVYQIGDTTGAWIDLILIAAAYLIGTTYFFAGNRVSTNFLMRGLAVTTLLPLPLFVLEIAGPSAILRGMTLALWGTVLGIFGELLAVLKDKRLDGYASFLLMGSVPLIWNAAVIGMDGYLGTAAIFLGVGSLLFLGATFRERRLATWITSLLFAAASYFTIAAIDSIRDLRLPVTLIFFIPAVGLIIVEMILRYRKSSGTMRYPPLVIGLGLTGLAVLTGLIGSGTDTWGTSMLVFLGFGILALLHALLSQNVLARGAAFIGFTLAFVYGLAAFDIDSWMLLGTIYAIVLYAISLGLNRLEKTRDWHMPGLVIALSYSGLLAMTAPEQGDVVSVISVAVLAGIFAIEGFRQRNIWFGFPVNLLLLEAWFMVLIFFDVAQPQLFSVPAAVLGIIMHYLLVRGSGEEEASGFAKFVAFGTGMLAILTMLSTTWIQMVNGSGFGWFFVLFAQSMVLLAYGLVVRSRSFLIVPALFVIFGVITSIFLVLEDLLALILLSCSGIVLLAAGVAALMMRERLLAMTDKLGNKQAKWRA